MGQEPTHSPRLVPVPGEGTGHRDRHKICAGDLGRIRMGTAGLGAAASLFHSTPAPSEGGEQAERERQHLGFAHLGASLRDEVR